MAQTPAKHIEKISKMLYIFNMPTEKPKILITMEDELLTRIDDYRFENRIPSRSEAIRQLIEAGLVVSKPKAKKK